MKQNFEIIFAKHADEQIHGLDAAEDKKTPSKAVHKIIGYMQTNLKHPSLHTHEYHGMHGPQGEKVFESYAQNKTPGAYRVFWDYGPQKGMITILEICPHP
jgi:hypothetical protein